ncbi:transcriptional regulator, AraC family [Maribacter sedimenticola]|uniref:Transcriptional regulator, AraC family n=1 Tax=Maribacter sedimenticola TaxID=228956 RepID=A0ABY1SIF1_9FLAO|nr:AraC family transcriptional regulator [Maribacter sedimenticola]SNR55406.1 transcriptional regulator, AraC family [Maribacter sedimenticola]
MVTINELIDQIPVRHNLTSGIMLLGVVQNIFISLIMLLKSKGNPPLKYLALAILFGAIIFLDVYVCYTGLMKHVLFLNDSTEPLVLLLGPMIYFSIYGFLKRRHISLKQGWWHFVLPVGYFMSQIPFYLAPLSVKLNAYLGAYFNDFPTANVTENFNYSYHFFKDIFDWLILISLLTYTILSMILVREEHARITQNASTGNYAKYIFTRNSALILCFFFLLVFCVFYVYDDDKGDQYIAIFETVVAFATTYIIVSESRFFDKSWVADKYETLGKPTKQISFKEIETFVDTEEYVLSINASLNDLAGRLQMHPNQISKAINLGFGSNFNSYINSKRIALAKQRLIDAQYNHLTIEAIGASVGFKSKSAFYNAFKKEIGSSPSKFQKTIYPKL